MNAAPGATLAGLLISALPWLAGPAVGAPPASGPEAGGRRFAQIPGGPRVLLLPQRTVPMFSCTVLVPAGSALETAETNGAAHYLEHLLFNGTRTRTREEIYARTDLLGAYNNASTQRERTVFQLLLPSESWRAGLELQADMLLGSTLPADMFEKEKGIILEELAKDRSNVEYDADLFVSGVLWGDDARALPVLGSEESIRNMDPVALRSFYEERYRPSGMTIVLMGDFDTEEVLGEIGRLYGGGDGTPPPFPARPDFPAGRAIHFRELPDLGKTRVSLLLPMPDVTSPELAAAELLAAVLDDGEHSAVQPAVEETGAVLSCGASLDVGPSWSVLSLSADLTPADDEGEPRQAAAVEAMLQHLERIAGNDAIARDIPSARRRALVDEISLHEKMHYYGLLRADLLASPDPAAAERLPRLLQTTGAGQVRSVLRSALEGGRLLATVAGPGTGEGTVELRSPVPPAAPAALPTLVDDALPATTAVTQPERRRTVLPGGMTLVVDAGPGARTFGAHLLLKNRGLLERRSGVPRGTSDVVHRMMTLGTVEHTEAELRGAMARLGTKIKVTDSDWIPYDDYYFSPEYSYVRLETIDAFAREALQLLGDMVIHPLFSTESLEKAKAQAVARAEREAGTGRSAATDLFLASLGEEHPEAGGVYGEADALRALSLEEAVRHHAAMIAPQNLVLCVSGSLPFGDIERAVTEAFADLPAAASPPASGWKPATGAPERRETGTGQEQSWIVVGEPLDVPAEDRAAVRVAVAVLSERLADQLREHEGLAYSIGAGLRLYGEGKYVRMLAGTRPDNLERMEAGMLEIARGLPANPPTEDEVEGARNRGEGRRLMRRLSRIGQAYAMAMAELDGRDPLALDADLPALRAVTPDDVVRVAERYLAFDRPAVAVAR